MSDLKARVGEPITAGKWNRVVDRLESTRAGFTAGGFSMSRDVCMIKNDSGNDRDIGELLAITGWDGPTGSDPYEIAKSIVYTCEDPVWHTAISRLVVLAEPIPDGQYGKAVLSGQCIAKLTIGYSDDQYVMIHNEYPNTFRSASSGIGRLLALVSEGGYAAINFRDGQPLWRYKLSEDSQAPAVTEATLYDLDGTGASWTCDLSDNLSLMDDQVEDDEGFCLHIGNEFHAIQGPCS